MTNATSEMNGLGNANPFPSDQRPDVQTLTYEAAREELVSIVRTLESGSASLEQTMQLWERGEALAARCQSVLDEAASRLEKAGEANPQ